MEDIILVLYVRDVEYGKRLLRFLAGKKNPRLHLELATEQKSVEYRVGTERQQLVILTDQTEVKEQKEKKRRVLYLANRQDREEGKIFQFQKAENIYRELVWQLKLDYEYGKSPDLQEVCEAEEGVYLVMAPDCGSSTVLSAMLSQYLGNKGKCLYLCMSGFPVYNNGELVSGREPCGEGISELLFALGQKRFAEKESALHQPFGQAWMLSPAVHYKDVLDCGAEDWSVFLRRLREECGYNSIVIEMGLLYEHTLDIMALADRVFLLQENGVQGRIRREVYERYCILEKKEALIQKTRAVPVTSKLSDWEQELELEDLKQLANHSQKMAYVERLLKGEEENVCLLEDDG